MTQSATSQPFTITSNSLINNFEKMCARSHNSFGPSYTHFVPKPRDEIYHISNSDLQAFYPIRECNCAPTMDRLVRERRVEYPLFRKVEQIFNKNKQLILYSLGSGSCYEELSVCKGLAERGYDVSQVVLVDTKYAPSNGLYGIDEKLALDEFKVYCKVLFPNAQISDYKEEAEYLEDIKISKQPKPDIILCIDVESAKPTSRQATYSKMLESKTNQCILAYHNHKSLFEPQNGVETVVTVIQGNSA